MAEIKITELPILSAASAQDVVLIVDIANNTTKQIQVSALNNYPSNTNLIVASNSARWNNTTTVVSSNSANWNNVYSNVNSNSANWNNVYSNVNSNSANWNNTSTTVISNSANWNNTSTTVISNSANWNNTSTTVISNSANWNNVYSNVNSNSANWNNVYSNVNSNSANWNNVYSNVNSNSANYILDGGNTKGSPLLIGTNDSFNLNFETSGTTRMTVTSSGNIGIGTSNPTAKLHINDTVLAGSAGLSGGVLNVTQTWFTSGTPTAFSLNVTDLSSNANSLLFNLLSGDSSRFNVSKSGDVSIGTGAVIKTSGNLQNAINLQNSTDSNQLTMSATSGTRIYYGATRQYSLQLVGANGRLLVNGSGTTGGVIQLVNSNAGADLLYAGRIQLGQTGNNGELVIRDQSAQPGHLCLGNNTKLMYDADNAFGVRNGLSAQTFSIYKSFSSSSPVNVYERLAIKSVAGNNNFIIGAETSPGSATWRDIEFQTLTSTRMTIKTTGVVNFASMVVDPAIGSSAPGDFYYNSVDNSVKLFTNSKWSKVGVSKTLPPFLPLASQPPSANFATLDTTNSITVLDFDDTANEYAIWVGVIPTDFDMTGGLKPRITWKLSSSTPTGNVVWGAQIERMNTDLRTDSWDSAITASGIANGSAGVTTTTEIALTSVDGLLAGEPFRIRVFRNAVDTVNDTATGDAELILLEVRGN